MKNFLLKRVVLQHCVKRYLSTSNKVKHQHVVSSKLPAIDIPRLPISKFVWDDNVQKHGDKIALVGTKYHLYVMTQGPH